MEEATSPTKKRARRPRQPENTSPSVTDRLIRARNFLSSESPFTYPRFFAQYDEIQGFINDLASTKELFDINVYNDVKAMLRVHDDRLQDRHQSLVGHSYRRSTSSEEIESPETFTGPRVFNDDLAYEYPSISSSTTTAANQNPQTQSSEQQEHPYEEGELLVFNPTVFGAAGPGYRHPAPKEVMGFDAEKGFVQRRLTSSEEEMFPRVESAKKRVMNKGFAQLDLSKKKQNYKKGKREVPKKVTAASTEESCPALGKERARETVAEESPTKRKRSSKDGPDPDVANKIPSHKRPMTFEELIRPNSHQEQTISSPQSPKKPEHPIKTVMSPTAILHDAASSKKQFTPNPFSSTPAIRAYEEEVFFDDPITLRNKRIKTQHFEPEPEPEPDFADDQFFQDAMYDPDFEYEEPIYDTDELEAEHMLDTSSHLNEDRLMAGDDDEDELATEASDEERKDPNAVAKALYKAPERWLGTEAGLATVTAVPKTENGKEEEATPMKEEEDELQEEGVEELQERGDDEEYLDEEAAFIPLTKQAAPTVPKLPKSKFLEEFEREEAKEANVKGPKAKTTKAHGSTARDSETKRLTPPKSKSPEGIEREEVEEAEIEMATRRAAAAAAAAKEARAKEVKAKETATKNVRANDLRGPDKGKAVKDFRATKEATEAMKSLARTPSRKETLPSAETSKNTKSVGRIPVSEESTAMGPKSKDPEASPSEKSKGKKPLVLEPDPHLPTPPSTSPPIPSPSSQSPAPHAQTYGHNGLIPPEIANASVSIPGKLPTPRPPLDTIHHLHLDKQHNQNQLNPKQSRQDERFYPGDPVFLFGETRYLTALKSRQIEKDLAPNDEQIQAEIDRRPLFGMFKKWRLPEPDTAYMEAVAEEKKAAERKKSGDKVVEGRVEKRGKKRGKF
ncbi:MAG: hypothetical protein Q9166_006514 [cf. Caloplaca sp. 2 TL-2023]